MEFKNLLKKAGEITNKAVGVSGVVLNSAIKNIEEYTQEKSEMKRIIENFNNNASLIIRDIISNLEEDVYQRLINYITSDQKPVALEILFNNTFVRVNNKENFIRQANSNDQEGTEQLCYINRNVIEPILNQIFKMENADKVLNDNYKWKELYAYIDENVFEINYKKFQLKYGIIKSIDEAINKVGNDKMYDKNIRCYLAYCIYNKAWKSHLYELNSKIDNEIIKSKYYDKIRDLKGITEFPVTRIDQKKKIPTLIWRENDDLKFTLNYNKKITEDIIKNIKVISLKISDIENFSLVSYDSISTGRVAVAAVSGAAGVAFSFIPVVGTAFAIANLFDDSEYDFTKTTTVTLIKFKNKDDILVFDEKDYRALNKLIPEKEKTIAREIIKKQLVDENVKTSQVNNYDEAEQIKKLASLRDEGILTEDEFQQKKKMILGL